MSVAFVGIGGSPVGPSDLAGVIDNVVVMDVLVIGVVDRRAAEEGREVFGSIRKSFEFTDTDVVAKGVELTVRVADEVGAPLLTDDLTGVEAELEVECLVDITAVGVVVTDYTAAVMGALDSAGVDAGEVSVGGVAHVVGADVGAESGISDDTAGIVSAGDVTVVGAVLEVDIVGESVPGSAADESADDGSSVFGSDVALVLALKGLHGIASSYEAAGVVLDRFGFAGVEGGDIAFVDAALESDRSVLNCVARETADSNSLGSGSGSESGVDGQGDFCLVGDVLNKSIVKEGIGIGSRYLGGKRTGVSGSGDLAVDGQVLNGSAEFRKERSGDRYGVAVSVEHADKVLVVAGGDADVGVKIILAVFFHRSESSGILDGLAFSGGCSEAEERNDHDKTEDDT